MTTVRIVSRPAAAAAALAVVAAVAVGACSSGGPNASAIASILANASLPPVASSAPTSVPSAAAASGAPSESALPSAVATDIDPCQLITSADATTLTGVTFGPGKESDNGEERQDLHLRRPGPQHLQRRGRDRPGRRHGAGGGGRQGGGPAVDANDLAKMRLTVTELPNFADEHGRRPDAGRHERRRPVDRRHGRCSSSGTRRSSGSATSPSISGQPPSEQAMKDEAMTLLGKVP